MHPHQPQNIVNARWSYTTFGTSSNWSTSALAIPRVTRGRFGRPFRAPCALCGRPNCILRSHRTYLGQVRHQGFRNHDVSRLLSTSFASSYAYNPLSVAIDHICGKLQLDFDPSDLGNNNSLPAALNKLISYDIGRNTPFTDPTGNVMGEVAAEWLVASSVDEIACASTLNLWVKIEWTNTRKLGLERWSRRLTSLFLTMLRERVESDNGITAGTIFAASNHLATCLIFFDLTASQMGVMMRGLQALVDASGGFESLVHNNHPGLFQSLLWNDVLYCALSGARPCFQLRPPPPTPYLLISEWTLWSFVPLLYERCCGPDLLTTAKHLRIFLRFRHGAEVRALTKIEYQYLVAFERYVHVQLLDQAARYHETGTIHECVVLAIALMRMAVLCIWEQHIVCRRMYVQRLARALRQVDFQEWVDNDALHALMWICYVVLAQSQASQDPDFILNLLTLALEEKLGHDPEDWPQDWENGFRSDFEPLLWHMDYDHHLPRVAKLVHDFIVQ